MKDEDVPAATETKVGAYSGEAGVNQGENPEAADSKELKVAAGSKIAAKVKSPCEAPSPTKSSKRSKAAEPKKKAG